MSLAVLFFYGFAFMGIVFSTIFSVAAIRNKQADALMMMLFLFVQSLIIIEYVFYWSKLYVEYPFFNNISFPLLLLFGPLLYLYIAFVFAENVKNRHYFKHFIPFFAVLLLMMPYYFGSADLKLYHYKEIKYLIDIDYIPYFIMVQMGFYAVLIFKKLIQQSRVGYINNWLMLLNSLFSLYILCYIFYYFASNQAWYSLKTDYFVSVSSCVSILSIIYFSIGKKHIFNGLTIKDSVAYLPKSVFEKTAVAENDLDNAPFVKYKNSGLTENARNKVAEALNDLMQREKLYRDTDLKLETLAQKLGVERHYVSQVINQHFGVNFFEYINLLRIEEAKTLLLTTDAATLNIIEIAYQVGYNTKNTFNAAFRRIVGVTPTEFRKQNHL